jgi:hypothetical protein
MKESFGKFMVQAADVLKATEAKYGFVKGLKAGFTLLTADFDAQGAAVAAVLSMGAVPSQESQQSWIVAKVSLVSPALVTGVATNNVTFNFAQYRAGVLVATFATLTLGAGTNLGLHAEQNVPVTGSPVLLAGDVIEVATVINGTGLALPQGLKAKVEIQ